MPKDQLELYNKQSTNSELNNFPQNVVDTQANTDKREKSQSQQIVTTDTTELYLSHLNDLINNDQDIYVTEIEMMRRAQEEFEKMCSGEDNQEDITNTTEKELTNNNYSDLQEKKCSIQLDIQTDNEGIKSQDDENQNTKKESILDDQSLKKYLAKETILNIPKIKKENIEFSEKLKQLKRAITLNDQQKEILEFIDSKMFPKTFKPEICKLLNQQICNIATNILGFDYVSQACISIFVPECCRMRDQDNVLEKIYKLQILESLPINYEVMNQYFTTNIYENFTCNPLLKQKVARKYLVACANKIENIDKLGIFVFFNGNIFDKDMNVNTQLLNLPINLIFFNNFRKYDDLVFGCYEFNVDLKSNNINVYYKKFTSSTQVSNQETHEKCTITLFHRLKNNVDAVIYEMKNKYFCKETKDKYLIEQKLQGKKRNLPEDITQEVIEEVKKQKQDLVIETTKQHDILKASESIQSNFFTNNIHSYHYIGNKKDFDKKMSEIYKKILEKYRVEKAAKTYDFKSLIELKNFNDSIFSNAKYINKLYQIRKNINKDIQNRLNLNPHNDLVFTRDIAYVLIPYKYFINNKLDSQYAADIKRNDLDNAEIHRYHFASSARTKPSEIQIHPNDNKIIVGLVIEMPEVHDKTANQIFVFLPAGFGLQGEPLLDPNSLSIYGYFYNDVKEYTESVGYPLYVFETHLNNNRVERDIDNSKYYYFLNTNDIDNIKLRDYIQKTYGIFDHRSLLRAKDIQNYLSLSSTQYIMTCL